MPSTSSDDLVALIQSLVLQCRAELEFLPLATRVREVALSASGTWSGSRSADTWQLTDDGAQTSPETSGPMQALVQLCDALIAGATSPLQAADALDAWLADALPDSERYELGSLIGKGGMGEIRAAQDRRLGRAVALKVLSRPGTRRTSRFLGEARLTAALEHPGIVPVHDLGTTTDGRPYFAMKQVKGRSLAEVLEAGDSGTLAERLDVVRKVCDAVAFAHSNSILHRDLKPANVMVGAFGEVLVMDWGLATREGDLATVVAGTPAYMAPEQAAGVTDLDARVDVYALGALLYELLVGRPAFDDADREEVLRRVRAGDFARPRQVDPSVPRELEELVLRCMAGRREDRLPDVATLKAELTRFLDGDDLHCVTYTPAERARRFMDRRWRAVATFRWAAGGLLVVLALSSAWYTADILRQRRRTLAELAAAQLAIGDAELLRGDAASARASYRDAAATFQAAGEPTWQSELALGDAWHRAPDALPVPLLQDRPAALTLSADGSEVLGCAATEAVQATLFGEPLARVSYPTSRCDVALFEGELVVAHRDGPSWVVHSLDPPREVLRVDARSDDEHLSLGPAHLSLWASNGPRRISLHTGEEEVVHPRDLGATPWLSQRLSPQGRFQIAANPHELARGVAVWEVANPSAEPSDFNGDVHFHDDTWLLEAWQSGLARWDASPPTSPDPIWQRVWRQPTEPLISSGLSEDHRWVWALRYDGTLSLSSAVSGEVLQTLSIPTGRLLSSVHAGSGHAVVARKDGSLDVHFALGRDTSSAVPLQDSGRYDIELTADGRLAVVAGGMNGLHASGVDLVDLRARRRLRRWDLDNLGTRAISLSLDEGRVAAAGRDGSIQVLDLVTGALGPSISTSLGKALAVEWVDATTLIVAGEPRGDGGDAAPSIVLVDLATGEVGRGARPFPEAIWDLDLSTDGRRVAVTHASSRSGPTLALLDARTLDTVASVEPSQGRSYGVAISADGQRVAAGTGKGALIAWWPSTGEIAVTQSDSGPTMGVESHPTRPWVFTTGFDGVLQAWDISEPGRPPRLLRRWWPEAGREALVGAGLGVGVARDTELTAWVGDFEEVRPVPLGEPPDLDTQTGQLLHRRAWSTLVQVLADDPGTDPAALATAWLALGDDRRAVQTLRDHPLPDDHPDRPWTDVVLGALAAVP